MVRYKWYVTCGETRNCFPNWKDDLALEYALESGQQFHRAQLSGSLTFLNADYTWIMGKSFGSKFTVQLRVQWQEGGSYSVYWTGVFYHTDCTINTDDKILTVKPTVEDRYTKILAGLDKEYDLIKLKTANTYVKYNRRPLLQVYTLGEDVVSCFLGGMSWEQEVNDSSATESQITNTYHFSNIGEFSTVMFDNPPSGLTDGFFGTWQHKNTAVGEWPDMSSNEGQYYMTYFQSYTDGDQYYNYYVTNGLRIYAAGAAMTPANVLWEFSQTLPSDTLAYAAIPATFTMTAQRSGLSNLSASWTAIKIFARWLVASSMAGGGKIPADDIVAYNRNYRYYMPCSVQPNVIRTTAESSTTPTEWGTKPDGTYYTKPVLSPQESAVTMAQYPVARTYWNAWSVWLSWTTDIEETESEYLTPATCKDAYALESVISSLLGEIDSNITFAATTNYSQFLYAENNPMGGYWGRLMITPKSNIKVSDYTQPAQKAPITLGEVLQMLKNVCGCYWCIDDSNRLRIEHVSWFKRGGSYSTSAWMVGYDLTAMTYMRNGKKWSFNTGTYSYDKIQMPQRYQYSWMDDTTDEFKGQPIEVLSDWVEQGNTEDVTVAKFNADIDYITLNPSNVNDDGFALLCCNWVRYNWWAQSREFTFGDKTVRIQNYQLAFAVLQPVFLTSDMPSWNIKVNGTATTANGIQRMKKQTVSVPNVTSLNTQRTIRTTIGDGQIERASIRLTSRMTKFNLRYDTSQQ